MSRFVPVADDRIESKRRLGPAIYLHEFLTAQQTSADGWVYYGKEFGYGWVRSHWLAAPPIRSLKRHMARLKALRLVEVRRTFHGGMRVRLLGSVKFARPIPPAAEQLPLLLPAVAPIRRASPVENPVEMHRKSSGYPVLNRAKNGPTVGPKMAPERSKEKDKEKIGELKHKTALPFVEKTAAALEARRQLLRRQAVEAEEKYKSPVSEKAKAGAG